MEFLTDRLRLREIGLDDIEAFHRYQNDPRYLEHYPYDRWDLSQTEKLVQRLIAWSKEKPRVKFQLITRIRQPPCHSPGVSVRPLPLRFHAFTTPLPCSSAWSGRSPHL